MLALARLAPALPIRPRVRTSEGGRQPQAAVRVQAHLRRTRRLARMWARAAHPRLPPAGTPTARPQVSTLARAGRASSSTARCLRLPQEAPARPGRGLRTRLWTAPLAPVRRRLARVPTARWMGRLQALAPWVRVRTVRWMGPREGKGGRQGPGPTPPWTARPVGRAARPVLVPTAPSMGRRAASRVGRAVQVLTVPPVSDFVVPCLE